MLTSIIPHLAGSELNIHICNCGSPGCLFDGDGFIIRLTVTVPFLSPDSVFNAMAMIGDIQKSGELPPASIPCFGYN